MVVATRARPFIYIGGRRLDGMWAIADFPHFPIFPRLPVLLVFLCSSPLPMAPSHAPPLLYLLP